MEQWEYAVGHERLNDTWTNDTEPGTFESASKSLIQREIKFGDEDWAYGQCIVKRSTRYPNWTPVHDHAAELLVEALVDMSRTFASHGSNIMQGSDLSKAFHRLSRDVNATLPQNIEEYDG